MIRKTGLISKDQKERILKATDVVQLIGSYVQLKASGKNYIGLCPFHHEKTPSFVVSPAYQNYKCYGCDAHGDAIRFIMEKENYRFPEAIRFLAERCGMEIKVEEVAPRRLPHLVDISDCLLKSFNFFRSGLERATATSEIRRYLRYREISERSIERFELGYVGPGWTNLKDHLRAEGINETLQERAGLVKQGEKGGVYDRMRNRLIFPIRDVQKRILGFAGRAIGEEQPKYLNPPETELYKKSAIFYGLYEAKERIRSTRRVIVVEGYLDVIRLHERSWEEAVATCGTSLTEEHIRGIKRLGVNEVFLLFDGDQAGERAAEKSAGLFLENDVDSRVVILPEGMDPDDYFKKHDSEEFQRLLDQSVFDFEFVVNQAKKRAQGKGFESQKSVIVELSRFCGGIKNTIKRGLFENYVAKRFGVKKVDLQRNVGLSVTDQTGVESVFSEKSRRLFKKRHLPEIRFLKYLMRYPESIAMARERVDRHDFVNGSLSSLYARFLQLSCSEFRSLTAKDFPVLFSEYNELIMFLLHVETEYCGPTVNRSSTKEMIELRKSNEIVTNTFSKSVFERLIYNLKRHSHSIKKRKLTYSTLDHSRSEVMRMMEERKRLNLVNRVNSLNKS